MSQFLHLENSALEHSEQKQFIPPTPVGIPKNKSNEPPHVVQVFKVDIPQVTSHPVGTRNNDPSFSAAFQNVRLIKIALEASERRINEQVSELDIEDKEQGECSKNSAAQKSEAVCSSLKDDISYRDYRTRKTKERAQEERLKRREEMRKKIGQMSAIFYGSNRSLLVQNSTKSSVSDGKSLVSSSSNVYSETEKTLAQESAQMKESSFCERFVDWNEITVTSLQGHISPSQSLLVMILNLILPGAGTIATAFMVKRT